MDTVVFYTLFGVLTGMVSFCVAFLALASLPISVPLYALIICLGFNPSQGQLFVIDHVGVAIVVVSLVPAGVVLFAVQLLWFPFAALTFVVSCFFTDLDALDSEGLLVHFCHPCVRVLEFSDWILNTPEG
jgi:hypothetical protein